MNSSRDDIISRFSGNLTKPEILNLVFISVSVFYICTNILNLNTGHVIAIFLCFLLVILKNEKNRTNSGDFISALENKLNSLSVVDNKDSPEYMYIDPDMILLFYEIKESLSRFNKDTYTKALKCVGDVLEIRYDSERKLNCGPEIPDSSFNGDQSTFDSGKAHHLDILNNLATPTGVYSFKERPIENCSKTLENIYENYQEAEKQGKRAINYIHSIIINIPSHETYHSLHEKLLNRLRVLVYRNLDIIKKYNDESITKNGLSHNSHFIDNIELPKSYDSVYHKDTFNFF
jgi:hypothetical protein